MEPLPQLRERIELTDRAVQAMREALRKARAAGIRIDVRDGKDGRTYRLALVDRTRSSDVVLARKGVVFYLSPRRAEEMPDLRIDYVRQDGREGFTVSTLGGCGCGPGCACGG